MVLGKTISLQFDFCPAKVRSSMFATPGRVGSCDNHIREDELHWLGRLRGRVSISAALHFLGDRDWKVVRSQAMLLFWSKAVLPSLLFPYWAVLQSLNCLKHISVCLNALKISFWTGINPLETPCDPWLLQPEEIIDFKAGRFITLLRLFVLRRFGWRKTNLIQREMF